MLHIIRQFVQRAYGDITVLPEATSFYASKAAICSPDRLIASAALELFVKDFDAMQYKHEYAVQDHKSKPKYRIEGPPDPKIQNRSREMWSIRNGYYHADKDIMIAVYDGHWHKKGDYGYSWKEDKKLSRVSINGVMLDVPTSRYLLQEIDRLTKVHEAAKLAARLADEAMKENEAKFNLAEQMLGMKRDENGALVPIVQVEE